MTTAILAILFGLLWLGTLACHIISNYRQARRITQLSNAVAYHAETIKAKDTALSTIRDQWQAANAARVEMQVSLARLTATNDEQRQALEEIRREQFKREEE